MNNENMTQGALLTAYKSALRQNLREALMPVANEVIDKAVNDAMTDLHVHVQTFCDDLSRRLVVELTVDGVKRN